MSDTDRNRILFLSVPESLRGRIDSMAGDNFSINPDIPIPVEIPEGVEKLPTEDLSWEMIISGMLRVVALGEESADRIDYYRHFVLAVKPDVFEEFTEAARLKARNGDFDLALEILETLRGLFPGSPSVLLNKALVLEEKASALEQRQAQAVAAFASAEAAFGEVLDINPPFPDAYYNAGFFYMGRKDFCRARELFAVYADFAEDNPKKNKVKKIIKEIDENGLGDENFSEAYKLVMQGNEEAGMNLVREFIELHPAVWNGWFVLGWALRRTGRWQDAAAAFGKAVEHGGGNSDTRNELAICLMETGDLQGARRELEAALHNDPENVKIISNLGVLALKNGEKDTAAAFFRTVLELDPDDPIANEQFK
jgi:Flp pilus assembly protein TadD